MSKRIYLFLAIMLVLAALVPAVSAAPLTVHPSNPRYFTDGSGKAVYLTGAHTWNTLNDCGPSDPPPVFDYYAWLDYLQLYGHNFFKLWNLDSVSWDGDVSYAQPQPWSRTGPGNALDGHLKFNLNSLNQAYFDRLRARVIAAGNREMYVDIMLFDGIDAAEDWIGHPFNVNNNINGINGDTNLDGDGRETHTLSNPTITAIQKAYISKVIDTVNDLDNVLYEISNEDPGSTADRDWQYEMINYIKTYEATKPKQHPVGMTTYFPDPNDNDLFNSPADWISPRGTINDYSINPVPSDGSKIMILDTDHIYFGSAWNVNWIWKVFLRGYNVLMMDNYGEIPPIMSYPDADVAIMNRYMGYALTYANKMNLAAMTPSSNSADCSTTYCLRNPGQEYLAYQSESGSFTVNLQAGTYNYEWFNPSTGAVAGTGSFTASSGSRSFTPPFSGDAVLYLKSSVSSSCGDLVCNGTETCSTCPSDCGACSLTPVAWWKFDEGSGTIASDSSGNGNTGTLINGPTWTTGKIGGALSFDGVDDNVALGSPTTLDDITVKTITAWIKLDSFGGGGYGRIIDKEDCGTGTCAWLFSVDGDTNSLAYLQHFTTDYFLWSSSPTNSMTTGAWYHVAVIYDNSGASNDPIFYINGVLQTATEELTGSGTRKSDAANNAYIGNNAQGAQVVADFDGLIDDVRVYNRALSSQEILSLYQSGTCIHKSDTDCDGCVDNPELFAFIDRWKLSNVDVTLKEIIEAIGLWKRGC